MRVPPAVLLQQWQASEDAAGAGASGGAGANGFALHCDGAIAASRLAKLRSFGNNESYAGKSPVPLLQPLEWPTPEPSVRREDFGAERGGAC